jgi:hypothetical protein
MQLQIKQFQLIYPFLQRVGARRWEGEKERGRARGGGGEGEIGGKRCQHMEKGLFETSIVPPPLLKKY